MTRSSRISEILDHLAWLQIDLGNSLRGTEGRRVLKHAFFVYNAATLFEWYVTVSRPDSPDFPYRSRDQARAKNQANRFVMLVAKGVDQIQKSQRAPGTDTAKAATAYSDMIEEALRTFLNSLPPTVSTGIRPTRCPELEMPVNPRELLVQRVSEIPAPVAGVEPVGEGARKAAYSLMPLVQVLGTIFALEDLKKTGELLPEAHAGLRDVTAGYLADALGEAAKSTTRSVSRRLQRLEKQVTNSITPAAPEQN